MKEVIGDINVSVGESLIPIIAEEVFREFDPIRVHEESLRLLHNCGFAVIDITDPAGQLMELERARDYGVITFVSYSSKHQSQMPVTLSKTMENWGLGYLFKYEHTDGLKKFVESILLINHLKGKTTEEIIRTITRTIPEKVLLITSIGVLNHEGGMEEAGGIGNLLEGFEKKILLSGWDFKTRGKDAAEKYNVESIVCENCLLYAKTNNEFGKPKNFWDESSLRLVKIANKQVIYTIMDYIEKKNLGPVVFFSQADEKSICYYLNPPKVKRKKLEEYQESSPYAIDEFIEKVKERCGQDETHKGDIIEYTKQKDSQVEESLLYAIEKINAMYRTLHSYSININEDKVIADLNPTNDYKEFSFKDVENIVGIALAKMKYYERLYNKVQPQKDVCIDIIL